MLGNSLKGPINSHICPRHPKPNIAHKLRVQAKGNPKSPQAREDQHSPQEKSKDVVNILLSIFVQNITHHQVINGSFFLRLA